MHFGTTVAALSVTHGGVRPTRQRSQWRGWNWIETGFTVVEASTLRLSHAVHTFKETRTTWRVAQILGGGKESGHWEGGTAIRLASDIIATPPPTTKLVDWF